MVFRDLAASRNNSFFLSAHAVYNCIHTVPYMGPISYVIQSHFHIRPLSVSGRGSLSWHMHAQVSNKDLFSEVKFYKAP